MIEPIPAGILDDPEMLDTYIAQRSDDELVELVAAGYLATERIPIERRPPVIEQYEQAAADQVEAARLEAIPDDVVGAIVLAGTDDIEAIVAALPDVEIIRPPTVGEQDADAPVEYGPPEWVHEDGYIFVRGVDQEALDAAIADQRAQ